MKNKIAILAGIPILASLLWAVTPNSDGTPAKTNESAPAPVVFNHDDPSGMRLEGERRFRTNCGRCHAAPHKFPPRMMATIVRHMRVRATITDEDMRFVLYYMTQ